VLRCATARRRTTSRRDDVRPEPFVKHLLAPVAPLLGLLAVALLGAPPASLAEEPKPAPPASPAEPAAPSAMAGLAPGGMVYVDVKGAKIGTPAEEVLKLAGKRANVLQILMYETPVHEPAMVPYFLDAYEVTNAQFHKFLEDTGRITVYKTGSTSLSTLDEIGSYFAYGDPGAAKQKGDKSSWAQVYELNKDALRAAMPDLLLDAKDKSRKLGDKEVKEAFRHAALVPDVELKVYRWRLPSTWFQDSATLEGEGAPDHPVRDVSYDEAEAYAEWAGKHVITEAEYEWAARGPEGRTYPWGNDWVEGIDDAGNRIIEKRCNWADLNVRSKTTFEPTTLPVADLPEGRSWCGAYHLLGNVAEWTSTGFDPYPGWNGSTDPAKNPWVKYHGGDYVKVIRGGSCADRERIALRCAYRDFIGIDRVKPPVRDNHFEYVGFRCGLYIQPGLDRLEPAINRLLRPKKLRREHLAPERFAGSVALRLAPPGATAENHVYVTGKAHAVLLIPVKQLFPETLKPLARTPEELLRVTPDTLKKLGPGMDALILGVFHTDVPIKAKVLDTKAAAPEPGSGRREGRPKESAVPATVDGVLPPDTYVLGLAYGLVGVYRSNLDFVAFLDKPTIAAKKLKRDEAPPPTVLTVDSDIDKIKTTFWVRLGGKAMAPEEGVQIECLLNAETGAIEKAGNWR
jgi:formylglycine-generating enzyme required for sulfatase activity